MESDDLAFAKDLRAAFSDTHASYLLSMYVHAAVLAERERNAGINTERAEAALLKPKPDDWAEPTWNARQLAIHSALNCAAQAIREQSNGA